MSNPRRRHPAALLILTFLVSLASLQPGRAAAPPTVGTVDARGDPRLARHIHLRSYGLMLGRVLQRLGEKSGVLLQVSGPPAEEPLVAFVPDAPLADVMASVADLYRLRWIRGGSEKTPAYRLIKTPAAQQEEARALDGD